MNRIIIITGQTATGKTSLALKLAQKYNGELINCDSRQIYRYLDIITGKDKQLLKKVKVWLYDVITPDKHFSSFDFVKLAIPAIKKILSRGKTPIIVGGTYLYLKHLVYGVETGNIPPNWQLRNTLNSKSTKELQNNLQSLNPPIFHKLSQSELNNPQRLIRKIEILTYLKKQNALEPVRLGMSKPMVKPDRFNEKLAEKLDIKQLNVQFIGLKFKSKESLRKAIKTRVEKRLIQGAIAEVKKLLQIGYNKSDPGLKTIGYQQLILHLKGGIDLDTAVQQWITKEVQYAKRQYTFMKKDRNIKWQYI